MKRAAIPIFLLASSCGVDATKRGELRCPEHRISGALQELSDQENGASFARCLTENVIRLQQAGGDHEEVARSAVAACDTYVSLFESMENIEQFEDDAARSSAPALSPRTRVDVKREARDYALYRTMQVRSGQCGELN